MKYKIIIYILCAVLFSTIVISHLSYIISGDAYSIHMPVKHLISEGNLNFWDTFNDDYRTSYFTYPSTDSNIVSQGEDYPLQSPLLIYLYLLIQIILGPNSFFFVNLFFSLLSVIFLYLITKKISFSDYSGFLAIIVAFSVPVLIFWSTLQQNILPSTFFVIIGVYYLLGKTKSCWFLSFLFLSFASGLRFFNLIFLLMASVYFTIIILRKSKNQIFSDIIFVAIPVIIIVSTFLLQNLFYFGNPFYVGYLNNPSSTQIVGQVVSNSLGFFESIAQKLFDINTSIITYFIEGTLKIYFPLFVSFPLIFIFWKKLSSIQKKYVLFYVFIFIPYFFFYSIIEKNLWKPASEIYQFNLALAFFRYMLPLYLLSIPIIALFLKHVIQNLDRKSAYIFTFLSTLLLVGLGTFQVINYAGGANLEYVREYSEQVETYSQHLESVLEPNSVILIATRRPFSYTSSHVSSYHWFWYDGIPRENRYGETSRVLDALLADSRRVYFFNYDKPYNRIKIDDSDIDIYEMFNMLDRTYDLQYVPEGDFIREKVRLYIVEKK